MANGTWNRRSHDKCAYVTHLNESVGPQDYMLFSGYHRNCGLCCSKKDCCDEKSLKTEESQVHGTRIDIENDLFNITNISSKCPKLKHQYVPPKNLPNTNCNHRNEHACYNWTGNAPKTTTTGYTLPNNNC